jgi:hypothetical protein
MLNDIDLVYLWVDSTDPIWQAKKNEALKTVDTHTSSLAARYRNHNELKYSLRSVEKHAPFIQNIYLITNQQRPTWLNSEGKNLFVVDHKDLFPDRGSLPCFSSNAIEAVMHRICGLSEFFLYASDDHFLLNDISVGDFLLANGKMLVRLSPYLVYLPYDTERDPFYDQFVNTCELMEMEFGQFYKVRRRLREWIRLRPFRKNYYHWNYPNHQIQIFSRSIAYEVHDRFPREVSSAIHEKFRSRQSIDVTGLLLYYPIYTGAAVPIFDKSWLYLDRGYNPSYLLWKSRVLTNMPSNRPKFLCLNDSEKNQHVDWGSYVKHLMESLFPNPSRFEKTNTENREVKSCLSCKKPEA